MDRTFQQNESMDVFIYFFLILWLLFSPQIE